MPSRALIPLPADVCPTCQTPTCTITVHQPALMYHGGYGATRSTVIRWCPGCRWHLDAAVDETRPDRKAD